MPNCTFVQFIFSNVPDWTPVQKSYFSLPLSRSWIVPNKSHFGKVTHSVLIQADIHCNITIDWNNEAALKVSSIFLRTFKQHVDDACLYRSEYEKGFLYLNLEITNLTRYYCARDANTYCLLKNKKVDSSNC